MTAMIDRKSKKGRDKRAIEFVGDLISKLFGNPGPSEWKQNTRNILAMKAAIERQISNSAIFHKDIDQNRHAINEQNEILRHISKEVINNSNRLNEVDNALSEFETYLELETMYHSILDILTMIDSIKLDAKLNRCNENGINKDFLIEHLREIESNKVGIAPIFASWEWHKYYKNSMCSLGIHDDDLWITLRIPVVSLSDQLVRVVPTSDQLWMRNQLFDLGIDSVLLKNKQSDIFMSLTRSEFESCSKLDFFRVCNIRKTKFRMSNPFIVPTSIGYGRVLLNSNDPAVNISAKCTCNGVTNNMYIQSRSIVRLPQSCSLIGKAFEISRIHEEDNVTNTVTLNRIDKVSLRRFLPKNNESIKNESIHDLAPIDNVYEKNNNDSIANLRNVKFDTFSRTETLLFATSGSTMGLILLIAISILLWKILRMCKTGETNKENSYFAVIENECKTHKKMCRDNDESIEECNEYDKLEKNADKSNEKAETDKLNLECEVKKPPFQQRRF